MTHRVRVSRLARLHADRLERERREWLDIPEPDLPTDPQWRQGYCEGLRVAQQLIRKGA
jgi:hypothetical protein